VEFFKSISYLYEVVHTNFSADLLNFAIFDRHFLEFVVPSSNENDNHVLPPKGRSLLKKLVPWGTDGRLSLSGDFRSLILE